MLGCVVLNYILVFQCQTNPRGRIMKSLLLVIFIIFLNDSIVSASEKDGVFEKIKSGLQYAKDYLETAKEVADLVSKSLGQRNNNNDSKNRRNHDNEKIGKDGGKSDNGSNGSETASLVSGFFRLLGLDSPRIAAIAVNSVIFLAQMISSLLDVKPKIEESRARGDDTSFDPIGFIVNNENERVQSLLKQAQDPTLPIQLISKLDGFDSACVRLLICKSSPIILAAQKSLKNKTVDKKLDLTSWLPNMEDFGDNADRCDQQHSDCILFPELT